MEPDLDHMLAVANALANPHRLRVIAALNEGRIHVSELARRLGLSRPLLYMHLEKLEVAGIVRGELELSEDGKAMKYYQLDNTDLRFDAASIRKAVERDMKGGR